MNIGTSATHSMNDTPTTPASAAPAPTAVAADRGDRPIVVIGAGAIGLCIAEQLASRGAPVVVIDKGGVAAGASFGNAGLLSFGHPPMTRAGVFRGLLRSLTNPRSPIYMPSRASLSHFGWLWAFRNACKPQRFGLAMQAIGALSHLSKAGFVRYTGELGLDFEHSGCGYMDVYRDPRRLDEELEIAELVNQLGLKQSPLTAEQAIERQPAIREGIAGAILHDDAAFAHPGKFCQALAEHLRSRRVDIRTGVGVTDIVTSSHEATGVALADGTTLDASVVVLATGAWSPVLASRVGVRLPILPGKGYHTTVDVPGGVDAQGNPVPPVTEAIAFSDDWVIVTPMEGRLRLAGLLEFDGLNHTMRDDRFQQLVDAAARNLRWDHPLEPSGRWCGLRPCTPDGLPIIGWAPLTRRLFVATGHAMMGFWTAPATGTLAAQLIGQEAPAIDPAPYRVDRF
jgi:D-amino-acid dehydrogenase